MKLDEVILMINTQENKKESNYGLEWSQNYENYEIMLHKFPRRHINSRKIESSY